MIVLSQSLDARFPTGMMLYYKICVDTYVFKKGLTEIFKAFILPSVLTFQETEKFKKA